MNFPVNMEWLLAHPNTRLTLFWSNESPFSNFHKSYFEDGSRGYTCMEQYMMYKKAVCFRDDVIAEKILETDEVGSIKELGRMVAGYNENYWNGIRQIVVYEGLIAKFSQNDKLREGLLHTKDQILAECAVKDRIWGIGLSMKDPDRMDLSKWRGQNLLGYTLMMIRDRL